MSNRRLVVIVALSLITIITLYSYRISDNFKASYPVKTYVINLKKNVGRWNTIQESNITNVKLERFDAVVGKDVDIKKWLNSDGLRSLRNVEKNGYRTAHYELTRGAIGCFISHYMLAKNLINDEEHDTYLIFEDDVSIRGNTFDEIQSEIKRATNLEWDILLLGTHRIHGLLKDRYVRVNGFWGMYGYLINKKGAEKFVKMVNKTKIDAQVDAYLSWMSQIGKINIYATKEPIVFENNLSNQTDIQIRLIEQEAVDPYIYRGVKV